MADQRKLSAIAGEIRSDWENVNFAAHPYLQAMGTLDTVDDMFGADSGKTIVLYFLSNAIHWRGGVARRVKKELKGMIK